MSVNDILQDVLKKNVLETISQKTWLDTETSKKMSQIALPKMLEALQNNAKDPKKAEALENAISKDHDWSIFDNLQNLDLTDWQKIVSHIFGDNKSKIEKEVGNSDVLSAIAPMLLWALWKQKQKTWISASKNLSQDSLFMQMSKKFLDKDWDWDIKNDLFWMAMNYIKGKKK